MISALLGLLLLPAVTLTAEDEETPPPADTVVQGTTGVQGSTGVQGTTGVWIVPGQKMTSSVVGDSRLFVYLGGVYVAFGDVRLWADNIVIWSDRSATNPKKLFSTDSDFRFGFSLPPPTEAVDAGTGRFLSPLGETLGRSDVGSKVSRLDLFMPEIYAEGHVRMVAGEETSIGASRIYFNLKESHGVILDGEYRTSLLIRDKKSPLVIRAAEIRQICADYTGAEDAEVSTCSFHAPHYHLSARKIALKGKPSEGMLGVEDTTLHSMGVPFLPLPDMSCALGEDWPIPLRRLRGGRSSKFGVEIESLWGKDINKTGGRVHEWLGVDESFKGSWFLNLDVYGKRGVGVGPGLEYSSPDLYDGFLKTYYINDKANRDRRGALIENEDRGWIQTRNRLSLPDFWLLDVELSYLSERNFLLEYFEKELREEKAQETLAHLHRAKDSNFFSLLANFRINDFQTETEHLPEARWSLSQSPLLERAGPALEKGGFIFHNLYYRHQLTASQLRFRQSDQAALAPLLPSERLSRADYLGGFEAPMNFGPIKLTPFVEQRLSWFDKSRVDRSSDYRYIGGAGATASILLSRVSEARSELLNINGLRHILEPAVQYVNNYCVNLKPDELFVYDSIEEATDTEVVNVLLRHRMQTRAEEGAKEGEVKTFFEGFYSVPAYPDRKWNPSGKRWGNFEFDVLWQPDLPWKYLKNISLNEEGEFNFYDSDLDELNSGLFLAPLPEFGLWASHRWIRGAHSYASSGVTWVLTPRWEVDVEFQRDLRRSRWMRENVVLRRRAHQWIFEFVIGVDRSDNNHSIAVSIMPLALFGRDRGGAFYDPSHGN